MSRLFASFATISEVADQLEVHPQTIRRWVRAGTFPEPLKIGNAHRWHRRVVTAWINRKMVRREPKPARAIR